LEAGQRLVDGQFQRLRVAEEEGERHWASRGELVSFCIVDDRWGQSPMFEEPGFGGGALGRGEYRRQ